MTRRAVVRCVSASGAIVLLVVACGGKVDGASGNGVTTIGTGTGTGGGHRPGGGGGGGIGRPETPVTAASIASDIAEDYCKTFSSCCVAQKLLPIDVARCRTVITTELTAALDMYGTASFDEDSAAECVATIHERISLCGPSDVNWEQIMGTPTMFAPASVRDACAAIIKPTDATHQTPCSTSSPCTAMGYTCAIDECDSNPGLGGDCSGGQPCLDGVMCNGSTCVAGKNLDVGGACATSDDCMLGLVCASMACAPAKEHPDLYKRRQSPYRVGADTCKSFTYL